MRAHKIVSSFSDFCSVFSVWSRALLLVFSIVYWGFVELPDAFKRKRFRHGYKTANPRKSFLITNLIYPQIFSTFVFPSSANTGNSNHSENTVKLMEFCGLSELNKLNILLLSVFYTLEGF